MRRFIDSNPGLSSRFTRYLHFEDYSPPELLEIFESLCQRESYVVSPELQASLLGTLTSLLETGNFGNARGVRNLFEDIKRRQHERLARSRSNSRDELQLLLPEDLPVTAARSEILSSPSNPALDPGPPFPVGEGASDPPRFARERLDDLVQILRAREPEGQKARGIADLFEAIIEDCLGEEPGAHPTAYSRSLLLIDRHHPPPHVARAIRHLGSLAGARRSGTLGPVPGYAWALVDVLRHFYGVEPGDALRELLGVPPGEFASPRLGWGELLPSFTGVLLPRESATSHPPADIELATEADPETVLTVRLDTSASEHVRDAATMIPRLPDFSLLRLTDLTRVEDRIYSTSRQTTVVLEPDFLFDVRDVAACFPGRRSGRYVKNPYRYLLGLLASPVRTDAMFLGNLINTIFDSLVANPRLPFEKVWESALSDADPLSLSLLTETALAERREEARKQYPNLARMAMELQRHRPLLEPTFLSAEFGLQGRLDILCAPESGGGATRDILELKSGKPPANGDHWESDRMQVMGYHLLLRSTFPGRTGTSRIFYSRRPVEETRNIPETPEAVTGFLTVRNRALFLLQHAGEGPAQVMEALRWLFKQETGDFGFLEGAHASVARLFKEASPLEIHYFSELASFVIREWRIAAMGETAGREGGFADLWRQKSVEEKEATFGILAYLRLRDPDPEAATGRLTFDRDPERCRATRFRKDDICVLYRHGDDHLDPLRQQLVKGRIVELSPEKVVVVPNHRLLGRDHFAGDTYWAIEADFNDSAFEGSLRSLVSFLSHPDSARRRVLLGLDPPRFDEPQPFLEDAARPLTEHQRGLVARALSARDYHLIQGPPGTGKTSGVLRTLIAECFRRGERVVVTAFTNRAVDEIERRLDEHGLPFVRLGRTNGRSAADSAQEIRQGRLFLATVSKLLQQHDQLLTLHRRLDTLIVDEASQVLEPQLIHLAAAVGRTILIGDHCQLPPIVAQPPRTTCISEGSELRALGFSDLRLTLFERLWRRCEAQGWDKAFGMLEEHFRMHEDVASLVNDNYGGRLKASTSQQRHPIARFRRDATSPIERLLATNRTVFVSTRPAQGSGSAEEARLAAAIARVVRKAYGDRFGAETLGIVTPWRLQINAIRSALGPELIEFVTVDTVERFQGMERDVILISLAVGNRIQAGRAQSLTIEEDGRLPVDRKLNVALSRARDHVLILGHEPILRTAPQYVRLIDRIRMRGGYLEHGDDLFDSNPADS